MLLKWIFTLLAIIWLYQAIRPYFTIRASAPPPAPPPQRQPEPDRNRDMGGEYIDYEEIK